MGRTEMDSGADELARRVMAYNDTFKRLVDEAKRPGFAIENWAPLAEYVAIDEFVRVGSFKEVVNWDQYIALVHGWATHSQWDSSFKAITEVGNRVFLELEERSTFNDETDVVNSLSVWRFNAAGKLNHLDIYLQQAPRAQWSETWKLDEA